MTARRGGALMAGTPGSSPTPVALSTTRLAALVDAGAESIRDAIGTGRQNAVGVQRDEYVRQLAKDFNRDRSKADKQIAAFVVDIAVRGTLEDALEIGLRLLELARMAHEEANPAPIELPFADLHIAEEQAEGVVDTAEAVLSHHDCLSAKEDYLRKADAYSEIRAAMDRAVRRDVIRAHVGGRS
jgi:hypothetical protein